MNCKEIITHYLRENGFDGLAGDGCGCEIDDLAPCGDDWGLCVPGHKIAYGPDESCPCGEGCDFHIVPGKRIKEKP